MTMTTPLQTREIPAVVTPLAYSVTDLTRLLGLCRTTVFSLIRDRELASIKVGRRRLVPAGAVQDFLARCQGQAS